MQLLLYLSLRYSTTKPDAKKREIIANLLTYPSEVSSMGSIFLGDEQTITTEGDTGHDKQKRRKTMRLDEGMVTHGERCDS